MLEVINLKKSFNKTIALENVSFSVKENEITGFLGPNGAGKTTTLKILTGLIKKNSGEIFFDGKRLENNETKILKEVGYLAENNPLYDDLRVDEILKFVINLSQKKIDKKFVKDVVFKCGLNDVLTKKIKHLSKGFKQRVGLAKALVIDPKFIFLDEPTTGLDPNQKEEILDLIKDFSKNKILIFSSHVLSEVKKIAEKIIIINKGKIVLTGKKDQLLKNFNKDHESVIIVTDATVREFKNKVQKIKNFYSAELISKPKKGFNEFEVICKNPQNFSIDLFKCVVKNRWNLMSLYHKKKELEDLFKDLTKE